MHLVVLCIKQQHNLYGTETWELNAFVLFTVFTHNTCSCLKVRRYNSAVFALVDVLLRVRSFLYQILRLPLMFFFFTTQQNTSCLCFSSPFCLCEFFIYFVIFNSLFFVCCFAASLIPSYLTVRQLDSNDDASYSGGPRFESCSEHQLSS
jgi:hypothetical protein